MKRHFLLVLIIFLLGPFQLVSQNLIPNPSFEIQDSCPTRGFHHITLSEGWKNATLGSVDYYHPCGGEFRHPHGTKKPFHGIAYAGIANSNNYREYLLGQLNSPLEKGASYKVSVHVSTSKLSNYTSSEIGIFFTNNSYFGRINAGCIEVSPQIENSEDLLIPADKWTEVSGEFIAEGGEEYIVIGYFNKEMNSINISGKETKSKDTYIFIDNVSTILLKRPKLELPLKGKTKILKTIYFEHNKYLLNKDSYQELSELTELLKDSNHVKIEIIGHTDESGGQENNLILSEKRAHAVVHYLIKKGISKERLKHKGLGSSVPIDPKNKNEKQAINRRVEFRVTD